MDFCMTKIPAANNKMQENALNNDVRACAKLHAVRAKETPPTPLSCRSFL